MHVIGDSHSSVFSSAAGVLPVEQHVNAGQFDCYHVGPSLAYNLTTNEALFNLVKTLSLAIFVFGEIDMRNIHKRVQEPEFPYRLRIDEVVNRYFEFLDKVSINRKIVFGVVPCLKETPFYDFFKDRPDQLDEYYAPAGNLRTRNKYKRYFNSRLNEECKKRNMGYFDLFNETIGREDLYTDDIHLNSTKVIHIINEKLSKLQSKLDKYAKWQLTP